MNRIILTLVAGVASLGATPMLLLPNGGMVQGAPGEQVGWAFSLTNDADFLVPTSAAFCADAFGANCTQASGVFADIIASLLTLVIGPGQTVAQPFDWNAPSGLGAFQIDPGAAPGTIEAGFLHVTYDRYDCDLNDPLCTNPVQTAFSGIVSAPAAVQVAAMTAVPEPSTGWLGGLALVLAAAIRRVVASRPSESRV